MTILAIITLGFSLFVQVFCKTAICRAPKASNNVAKFHNNLLRVCLPFIAIIIVRKFSIPNMAVARMRSGEVQVASYYLKSM
jgi:hypothetical protein